MDGFTLFFFSVIAGCTFGFMFVVYKIIQDEKEIREEKARIRLCFRCRQAACVCSSK